jgi:hypothetical protein
VISHVVLLKFKPGTREADIRELEAMLEDLPNRIQEIRMYEFGRNQVPSGRAYDFGLVSLFANLAALERYQKHPAHLPVLARVAALCEHVATVDFEAAQAGPAGEGGAGGGWQPDPFDILKR